MANKKITELTNFETPVAADVFPIVDTVSDETKKVSLANLTVAVGGGISTALDDLNLGDEASLLGTTAGDITLDAQGDNTDIIFKGTDNTVDTTFLTLEGSAAGRAIFNSGAGLAGNTAPITTGISLGNPANVIISTDGYIGHITIGDPTNTYGSNLLDVRGAANVGAFTTTGITVATGGTYRIGSAALEEDELEILDGATLSTAELNILDGATLSTAELNILDGATLSTAELNYVDGVTSSIQTQIDAVSSLIIADEGGDLATGATKLDFVGSGVVASGTGTTKTITISGGGGGGSSAADDITIGDALVEIATTVGNITLDAQATDTDIIFKGTDGGVDTTFLTLDGSEAGKAIFNADVTIDGTITSTATGTPTLTSASNINIPVGGSIVVQQNSGGGGFRVGNLTTTERNALASADGEIIYNTTTNKFQGYENGAWVDLV